MYLRAGLWAGERVLPAGWAEHARTVTPGSAGEYGAHWWLPAMGEGMLSANGYRGQYVFVAPARDLVVVRLGESTADQQPLVREWLASLVARFPLSERAAQDAG